jgi:Uma2 family endonuclease
MSTKMRFTTKDLEAFPDSIDGTRYEIIDGELFMAKQPHWNHQGVSDAINFQLATWGRQAKLGRVRTAPGVIFADDDNVAPDLVWISYQRLAEALAADGKLHIAPELIVEVLSPGTHNESRDKEAKLKLYSRRGVLEYWIADWQRKQIEVYRQNPATAELELAGVLLEGYTLESL